MEYFLLPMDDIQVMVNYASFASKQACKEYHAIFTITDSGLETKRQIANVNAAIGRFSNDILEGKAALIWRRCFLSDPVNQISLLNTNLPEAVSITGQAPLNHTKMIMMCYFVEDAKVDKNDEATVMKRPGYEHYYYMGMNDTASPDEYIQSVNVFNAIRKSMKNNDMSFSNDLVRTWIFVNDVDNRYAGMVKARNEVFQEEGLTEHTHFIASTGIEGIFSNPKALAFMDAYAIKGLNPGQITFLKALEYLSPTAKYGVAFERGTSIEYGDRKHLFISGTASIDKFGDIVYPMDIVSQAKRTLQNISALLEEGGANLATDLTHLIVYLRDMADYETVKHFIEDELPEIPKMYMKAPVCRPAWLIEMECSAIIENSNAAFKPF